MGQRADNRLKRLSRHLTVAVFVLFWVAIGSMVSPQARNHDFLNLYTGASLALDGHFSRLHDIEVQLGRERSIVPGTPVLVPYVRPHFHAALLAPLALMPFATAFWVWLGLQAAVYAGAAWWAQRRFGGETLVWWSLFLPGAIGIAHGQDSALMLAVLTAGFALSERGRPVAAGLVWSLLLMKFHLCLGLAVALLAGRMWRQAGGFAAGGLALSTASLALGGVAGAQSYIAMLTNPNLERLSPAPQKMVNLQGLAANLGFEGGWILALGAAAGMALLLLAAWKSPPRLALAAGAVGGLLAVPHVYLYDLTWLFLPLILLMDEFRTGPVRWLAALMLAPAATFLVLFEPPWCVAGAAVLACLLASLAWTRWSGDFREKRIA